MTEKQPNPPSPTTPDLTPEGIELIAAAIAEADVGHNVTLIRLVNGQHTVRATFGDDVREFTDDAEDDAHDKAYAFIREGKHRVQAECVMRALAARATPAPTDNAAQDTDTVIAPRWLIAAACGAIDKKRDAPRTLANLRQIALSEAVTKPTDNAALVDALTNLIGHADWVASNFDIHYAHLDKAKAVRRAALSSRAAAPTPAPVAMNGDPATFQSGSASAPATRA